MLTGRTDRMAGWRAEKLGNKRLEAAKNIVEWKYVRAKGSGCSPILLVADWAWTSTV